MINIYTHNDISNLVNKTVSNYFDKSRAEVIALREKREKKEITVEEYNRRKELLIATIIKNEEETLKFLLLSNSFGSLFKHGKMNKSSNKNNFCFFDTKTNWRKEVVKDFYSDKEDSENFAYKGGRINYFRKLVGLTRNLFEEALRELDFNVFKKEGLEADDLIAIVISFLNDKSKERNVIMSNDIDFLQLQQQENVSQYSHTKKDYYDITPEEAEIALLTKVINGDGSDNIKKITNFDFKLIKENRDISPIQLGKLTNDFISKYGTKDVDSILQQITNRLFIKQLERNKEETIKLKPVILKALQEKVNENPFLNIEEELKELITSKKETKTIVYKADLNEEELKTVLTNEDFLIDYKFEEIKENLLKNYEHNNKIINFKFIPENLKSEFIEEQLKEGFKTPLQGLERSRIFIKYNLFEFAKKNDYVNEINSFSEEDKKVEEKMLKKVEEFSKFDYTPYIEGKITEENLSETPAVIETVKQINAKEIDFSLTDEKYIKFKGDLPTEIENYLTQIKDKYNFKKIEGVWIIPNVNEVTTLIERIKNKLIESDFQIKEPVIKKIISIKNFDNKYVKIRGNLPEEINKYLIEKKDQLKYVYNKTENSWILPIEVNETFSEKVIDFNLTLIDKIRTKVGTEKIEELSTEEDSKIFPKKEIPIVYQNQPK